MRTVMVLVAAVAVTISAAYSQDFTPPDPPTVKSPAATPSVCPACGQRLRQAAGWRRTFGEIASDLEAAALEEGADGRMAGMLARAVRIMEADAATGEKLHERLDPRFMNSPNCRAPYRFVAEVLSSREVAAGLPSDVAAAYAKLGRTLLDDRVCIDLTLTSEAGEWSSLEQIIRTLNAVTDKYAPNQARARRDAEAESRGAGYSTGGRYSARGRPVPRPASRFVRR